MSPEIITHVYIFVSLFFLTFFASVFYWQHILLVFGFVYNFPLFVKMKFYHFLWWVVATFCRKKWEEDREISVLMNYKFKLESRTHRSRRIFFEQLSKFITGDKSMITLEKVGDRIEYVPESERGKDNPTTFYFEKKPREELAQKRDELIEVQDGSVDKFKSSTVAYKVTLYQLCDWKNVCNSDGEPVQFKESIKAELYDRLPVDIQNELEGEFSAGVATREEEQAQEEAEE